jgi:hypothetical protein
MVHDSGEEKSFIYLFLLGRKECFFIICLYAHTFVQYILGKGGEKTCNKNQDNINIHTAEPNKNPRKTSGAGENRGRILGLKLGQ